MSKIGYYRYKTTVTDGRVVTLYKNGIESGTATIKALEFCEGYRILKYLDSTGKYRFFSFTKFYETNDNPSQIGTTNKFITSILNSGSNKSNIGYRNERTIDLSVEVDEDQLKVLSSIYVSPRVYLYIGSGIADNEKDWLQVSDLSGDTIVRRRRQKTGLVNITITLPEWFTIKMI